MLTFLRSAAGTLIAKILLGLLIASFAVWGISGAALNFASGTLGSVGTAKISTVDFQREYVAEINRLGRQFNQQLTPTQARQFGLDRQVLSRMINQAALDDRASAFGIGVSDDRIADEILKDPTFQNARGEFDAFRYQQLILGSGLTEALFLNEQKKAYERQQIIDTLVNDIALPDVLKQALKTHSDEERMVRYLEVDIRDIDPVEAPETSILETYFDTNKTAYRAPEYRSIQYLSINMADLGGADSISDEDARAYYEANQARYTQTEKRNIRRINFETEAKARDAETKLKQGTTFDQLVSDLGLSSSDVFLGVLSKEAIIDAKLAEAAFKLDVKTPSGVINGDFGKMIIIVDDIEGGSSQPFEEVASAIKNELAGEKNNRELLDKLDQVEDARAAGSTFSEIAQKFSLKLVKLDDVAQSGERQSGGEISTALSGRDQLLSEAFQSDVGLENDVIEVGREGFIWYEVTDIKAARDRTLDEVKTRVEADWIAAETIKNVTEKAEALAEQLKSGKTIADLEADLGRLAVRVEGVKRNQPVEGLSGAAVAEIFKGPEGHVATALGDRDNLAYIMQVADISHGTATDNSQTLENLTAAMQNDIIGTYIDNVRQREGTSINPEALALATDLDGQNGHGGNHSY